MMGDAAIHINALKVISHGTEPDSHKLSGPAGDRDPAE